MECGCELTEVQLPFRKHDPTVSEPGRLITYSLRWTAGVD